MVLWCFSKVMIGLFHKAWKYCSENDDYQCIEIIYQLTQKNYLNPWWTNEIVTVLLLIIFVVIINHFLIAPRFEYLWADGTNVKKPIKCTAPKYIDYLMTWVQEQLDDETLFPSKIGKFYQNPFGVWKNIWCLMNVESNNTRYGLLAKITSFWDLGLFLTPISLQIHWVFMEITRFWSLSLC